MKRRTLLGVASITLALAAAGGVDRAWSQAGGWVTLLDSTKMGEWDVVGDANWRMEAGAVVADKKTVKESAFLVTKESYKDFEIKAEFWSDEEANSGIFIRCTDAKTITSKNSYEVNIFDKRPDPSYGTGAIVDVAKVSPMPKAAGKWNTLEIVAKGPRMIVKFNGVQTVDVEDARFASGPFALQYGSGVIKFRKVEVRKL